MTTTEVAWSLLLGSLLLPALGCAPNQRDYPSAVGLYQGTLDASSEADVGTVEVETSDPYTLSELRIWLEGGIPEPPDLVFEGEVPLLELSARTFSQAISSERGDYLVEGGFDVFDGAEETDPAVWSRGTVTGPDGTWSFEAKYYYVDAEDDFRDD